MRRSRTAREASLDSDLNPRVIVEVSLKQGDGLELVKIRAHITVAAVLVLSMHDEAIYASACCRRSERFYIMKAGRIRSVLIALRGFLGRRIYVSEPSATAYRKSSPPGA